MGIVFVLVLFILALIYMAGYLHGQSNANAKALEIQRKQLKGGTSHGN